MKATEWFSVKTPPARIGYYEIMYNGASAPEVDLFYFDGICWLYREGGSSSFFGNQWKDDFWRGLTEPLK